MYAVNNAGDGLVTKL